MSLNEKVLILNKYWLPVNIKTLKSILPRICAGRLSIVGSDYMVYDWEQWIEATVPGNNHIITTQGLIAKPTVAISRHYDRVPKRNIKLSKKNVFRRDGYTCAYSGRKLTASEATVDHVIPRSRGGETSWLNLVTCSRDINIKKGNRSLRDSGYQLLYSPYKPQWLTMFLNSQNSYPEEWKVFFKNTD